MGSFGRSFVASAFAVTFVLRAIWSVEESSVGFVRESFVEFERGSAVESVRRSFVEYVGELSVKNG